MTQGNTMTQVDPDVARCLRTLVHDVNNHLAVISGQAQMIQLKADRGAFGDEFITEACTRARLILEAIGRCEAFFARLRTVYAPPVNAGGTVALAEVCSVALARLSERYRDLEVEVTSPPDVVVAVERAAAVAALYEVLDNAAQAVVQGGVVRLTSSEAGSSVRVRVEDTGVGLPAGELVRVFRPFAAAWPAAETAGLGLTVARTLLEPFGGYVELTSPGLGQGASCTLTLPIVGR